VKFGTGERTVSPLRGEKPIFGPLSKNKNGMAALRAGLPVTSQEAQLLWRGRAMLRLVKNVAKSLKVHQILHR